MSFYLYVKICLVKIEPITGLFLYKIYDLNKKTHRPIFYVCKQIYLKNFLKEYVVCFLKHNKFLSEINFKRF